MKSPRSTFLSLLQDERSAVRLNPALLALLVILVTAATGLLLMSLAEGIHLGRARGVLRALLDQSAGSLPV
ncbi:MAG: hypothetical protein ACREIR_13510 [Geminicoccaceae bacterium]